MGKISELLLDSLQIGQYKGFRSSNCWIPSCHAYYQITQRFNYTCSVTQYIQSHNITRIYLPGISSFNNYTIVKHQRD